MWPVQRQSWCNQLANMSDCSPHKIHVHLPPSGPARPIFHTCRQTTQTRYQVKASAGAQDNPANLGPPKNYYAGQSFQVGAAISAAIAGNEDSTIQTLGRWQSAVFLEYIQLPHEHLAQFSGVLAATASSHNHQKCGILPTLGPETAFIIVCKLTYKNQYTWLQNNSHHIATPTRSQNQSSPQSPIYSIINLKELTYHNLGGFPSPSPTVGERLAIRSLPKIPGGGLSLQDSKPNTCTPACLDLHSYPPTTHLQCTKWSWAAGDQACRRMPADASIIRQSCKQPLMLAWYGQKPLKQENQMSDQTNHEESYCMQRVFIV